MVLCYGKEPVVKRSLVSPLCKYIVAGFSGNTRWEIVRNDGFGILQKVEVIANDGNYLDAGGRICYDNHVGAVCGPPCFCRNGTEINVFVCQFSQYPGRKDGGNWLSAN